MKFRRSMYYKTFLLLYLLLCFIYYIAPKNTRLREKPCDE